MGKSKMDKYFARPKESRGAKGFNLKDNVQAGEMRHLSANSEQSDMGRMRYDSCGSKGYPSQAFAYDY